MSRTLSMLAPPASSAPSCTKVFSSLAFMVTPPPGGTRLPWTARPRAAARGKGPRALAPNAAAAAGGVARLSQGELDATAVTGDQGSVATCSATISHYGPVWHTSCSKRMRRILHGWYEH